MLWSNVPEMSATNHLVRLDKGKIGFAAKLLTRSALLEAKSFQHTLRCRSHNSRGRLHHRCGLAHIPRWAGRSCGSHPAVVHEPIHGSATEKDQVVAQFQLREEQPVFDAGPLPFSGSEEWSQLHKPFARAAGEIVRRQ